MEQWKDIAGWESFYQVSDQGRVRSVDRTVVHGKHGKLVFYKGRVLKVKGVTSKSSRGYAFVAMTRPGGRRKTVNVHRLVAQAFVPNPDNLPQVRHLNENPLDNRAVNLAWGTQSDNYRDITCWNCGAPYHKRQGVRDSRKDKK